VIEKKEPMRKERAVFPKEGGVLPFEKVGQKTEREKTCMQKRKRQGWIKRNTKALST